MSKESEMCNHDWVMNGQSGTCRKCDAIGRWFVEPGMKPCAQPSVQGVGEALRETVTAAIYDAFHNMTLPSMASKFNTMGECKDYVTKVVTDALTTGEKGGE